MVSHPVYVPVESEIRRMIEALQNEEGNYPLELGITTRRLLGEAEQLGECLNAHDVRGFKSLLEEMREESQKMRIYAQMLPDLPQQAQKSFEAVHYSIRLLCQQMGLN